MKVYICGISFRYELGEASGGNQVYPSVEDLNKHSKCCHSGCGVVELDVTLSKWIEEQNHDLQAANSMSWQEANLYLIEETKKDIVKLQNYLAKLEEDNE